MMVKSTGLCGYIICALKATKALKQAALKTKQKQNSNALTLGPDGNNRMTHKVRMWREIYRRIELFVLCPSYVSDLIALLLHDFSTEYLPHTVLKPDCVLILLVTLDKSGCSCSDLAFSSFIDLTLVQGSVPSVPSLWRDPEILACGGAKYVIQGSCG